MNNENNGVVSPFDELVVNTYVPLRCASNAEVVFLYSRVEILSVDTNAIGGNLNDVFSTTICNLAFGEAVPIPTLPIVFKDPVGSLVTISFHA